MSDYPAGTVAVATVRGVKGVRIFRYEDVYGHDRWDASKPVDGVVMVPDKDATDVRPLIVLDPKVDIAPTFSLDWLRSAADTVQRDNGYESSCVRMLRSLADQIEAQTRPPRIPEPGLWAVVEALIGGEVFTFVNRGSGWVCVDDGALWEWDRLDGRTLIREGLS